VLHRIGYTGTPVYRGRLYRQFGLGRCKVHLDILAHPSNPTMMAWFTMARGDDLADTLEGAAYQAPTEFCEHHLSVLNRTTIALLPVWNESNAVGDPELPTHHMGWSLTARYGQHMSSLLQEVMASGTHQRLRLEEYVGQVKAKNCAIKDIRKGNQELLQTNARLETCVMELNNELMRTYRTCDFKADLLDVAHTQLQHTQDELTTAQSYVHHLETELHE
jgi:hypothetical protein